MYYNVKWNMLCSGGGYVTGIETVEANSRIEAIQSVLESIVDEEADVYSCGGTVDIGDIGLAVRGIDNKIYRMYCITKCDEVLDEHGESQRQSC